MKTIECIIVDDDIMAIVLLEKYIERLENFNVFKKFTNPIEAISFLQQNDVDLIFLDIEMPNLSGIDFIKILSKKRNIILITSSRHYAMEAYDLEVIDYVLKPINYDRFTKAVNKFKQLNNLNVSEKKDTHSASKQGASIYVKENYKTKKILIDDIIYIESDKEYIKITTKNSVIRTKQSLNRYDNDNDEIPFLRIHRSFVINTEKIISFTNTEIQVGNKFLPIGRSFRKKVKDAMIR